MADHIEVNFDDILKKLPDEKKAKKAFFRAASRAAAPVRTMAARETSKMYHVTREQVRKIDVVKREPSAPALHIKWIGPQIPLIEWETTTPKTVYRSRFGGRANSPQVSSVHKKSSARVNYTTAFAAKLGSNVGIYRRTTKARFPIKKVLGPAIPQLIRNQELQDRFAERAAKTLWTRLDHEVNRMLQ